MIPFLTSPVIILPAICPTIKLKDDFWDFGILAPLIGIGAPFDLIRGTALNHDEFSIMLRTTNNGGIDDSLPKRGSKRASSFLRSPANCTLMVHDDFAFLIEMGGSFSLILRKNLRK